MNITRIDEGRYAGHARCEGIVREKVGARVILEGGSDDGIVLLVGDPGVRVGDHVVLVLDPEGRGIDLVNRTAGERRHERSPIIQPWAFYLGNMALMLIGVALVVGNLNRWSAMTEGNLWGGVLGGLGTIILIGCFNGWMSRRTAREFDRLFDIPETLRNA